MCERAFNEPRKELAYTVEDAIMSNTLAKFMKWSEQTFRLYLHQSEKYKTILLDSKLKFAHVSRPIRYHITKKRTSMTQVRDAVLVIQTVQSSQSSVEDPKDHTQ